MDKNKKGFIRLFICLLIAMILLMPASNAEAKAKPKLNKTAVTVYVKGKTTLKLSGAKVKSWKSSNTKVAKVSSKGVVTAVKAGTAKITCTDKKGKKYTCKVTVKNPYISATSKTLNIGKSFTLKLYGTSFRAVSIYNASAISYTYKNNGMIIKGKRAGKAEVSFMGTNGKKYTCKIIVKDPNAKPAEKKDDDVPTPPKHTHSYVEYYRINASCFWDGYAIYYCSCGDYCQETLKADGAHTYTTKEVEATCIEGSHIELICAKCGNKQYTNYKDDVKDCEYLLTADVPSTCTTYGYQYYNCTNCGRQKVVTLFPEHKNTYQVKMEQKICTEYSYIETFCSDCNQRIKTEYDYSSFKQHVFEEDVLASQDAFVRTNCFIRPENLGTSSCYGYVMNYYERKCKNCSYAITYSSKSYKTHKLTSIKKTQTGSTSWYAHDNEANKNYCGEHTDSYSVVCAECGPFSTTHVEYVEHVFDTDTISKAPTLTSKGLASMKCQTCTYSKQNVSYWVTRFCILQREKKIINSITTSGMTDEQKYRAIYEWLATNVTYDYDTYNYILGNAGYLPSIDHGQSAGSAIYFNSAVCAGFAAAFDELCEVAGLECKYVHSRSMSHAWNLIKISGTWYWVDSTWAANAYERSKYSVTNKFWKQTWSTSSPRSADEIVLDNPTYYHYGY